MEYSKNFGFALPSSANDVDLADINEIANNFRKIDENAVKKEAGKGLSENDFTDAEKQKLQNALLPENIDQKYNPTSENPQSGIAVAQATKILKDHIIKLGKNLYDETKFLSDTRADGTTRAGETCSYWIKVVENESYVLSRKSKAPAYFRIYGKDSAGTLTSIYEGNITTGYVFTIPSGITHVRFSCANANFVDIQFEQGTEKTNYEPYTETINPSLLNFLELKSIGKNLLNRDASISGRRLTSSGDFDTSWAKNDVSDFIPVAYGDTISISGVIAEGDNNFVYGVGEYDENFKLVNFYDTLAMLQGVADKSKITIKINRNIHYIRVDYRNLAKNIQVERATEPTEYEPFSGEIALKKTYNNFKFSNDLTYSLNQWYGKKLVVDGDSITHDKGKMDYWQFAASNILEMVLPDNLGLNPETGNPYPANGRIGIGGSRIANENGANNLDQSIVLRYQNLPDDADLVMIAGGSNDWGHSGVELGDFDSTDDTTFYGALNILCAGLKEKYPDTPVVLMTPIKRGAYGQKNAKGLTQEQFVDAMIRKCRQYNIYCLDMWANCPINPNITSMANTLYNANVDLVHPNTEGHKVMGKTVAGFIRTLN